MKLLILLLLPFSCFSQTVTLNGTKSSDADGFIASYLWKQGSGPTPLVIVNASSVVANTSGPWAAGTYKMYLTVTDDKGASKTDSMYINATVIPVQVITDSVYIKEKTKSILTLGVRSSRATMASVKITRRFMFFNNTVYSANFTLDAGNDLIVVNISSFSNGVQYTVTVKFNNKTFTLKFTK